MTAKKGGARKALEWAGAALLAAWLSYSLSAVAGVLGRSVASVEGTSWLSFDSGKLVFRAGEGRWNSPSGQKTFTFAEEGGIVTASFKDGGEKYFVRQGKSELITGDGRGIWYLYEKTGS